MFLKPCKEWEKNYHINWLAGFVSISSMEEFISHGQVTTSAPSLAESARPVALASIGELP